MTNENNRKLITNLNASTYEQLIHLDMDNAEIKKINNYAVEIKALNKQTLMTVVLELEFPYKIEVENNKIYYVEEFEEIDLSNFVL